MFYSGSGATLCFFGNIAENLGASIFIEAENFTTGDIICKNGAVDRVIKGKPL